MPSNTPQERAVNSFNRIGANEPERFVFDCAVDGPVVQLRVKGQARMVHAQGLMNALTGVLDSLDPPATTVKLDLATCTGLDSSTGGLLILMGKELEQRNTRMILQRPSDRIQRILGVLGLDELTGIEIET